MSIPMPNPKPLPPLYPKNGCGIGTDCQFTGTEIKKILTYYKTHKFYPKGIAKAKKKKFTANELIDIYIKANPDILLNMRKMGFGDKSGFLMSESEWFNALAETANLREAEVKFAMFSLITNYLDAPQTAIGLSTVALLGSTKHTVLIGQCISVDYDLPKEVLIEGIGETCSFDCMLYYKFFKSIREFAVVKGAHSYYNSHKRRAIFIEDIARTLEEMNKIRIEIETLSKQINKIARENEKR